MAQGFFVYTPSLVYSFKVFLIQFKNAKAYCIIFDWVVLFCSVCCFICWFMFHNKSI